MACKSGKPYRFWPPKCLRFHNYWLKSIHLCKICQMSLSGRTWLLPMYISKPRSPWKASLPPTNSYISMSEGTQKLSGAREFHPRALREPDMNLSTHPAPIVQPQTARGASGQRATVDALIFAAPIDVPADYVLSVFCISVKPTKREYDQSARRSSKEQIYRSFRSS